MRVEDLFEPGNYSYNNGVEGAGSSTFQLTGAYTGNAPMTNESCILEDLMLLSRVAQIVLQEEVLEDLEEAEVTLSRANILRLLGRQGRQTVNNIAAFLDQTKAAASQNVDSLVKAGLVCRETDDADRRCVWVSLSPRGKGFVERAENRQRQVLLRALDRVPKPILRKLSQGMRSLALALLEHSEIREKTCLQCCAYASAGCVQEAGSWRCAYLHNEKPSAALRPSGQSRAL